LPEDPPIVGVWLYLVPLMKDELGVPPGRRLAQFLKSANRTWRFRCKDIKAVYATKGKRKARGKSPV
jgi:hypothetical protein